MVCFVKKYDMNFTTIETLISWYVKSELNLMPTTPRFQTLRALSIEWDKLNNNNNE